MVQILDLLPSDEQHRVVIQLLSNNLCKSEIINSYSATQPGSPIFKGFFVAIVSLRALNSHQLHLSAFHLEIRWVENMKSYKSLEFMGSECRTDELNLN